MNTKAMGVSTGDCWGLEQLNAARFLQQPRESETFDQLFDLYGTKSCGRAHCAPQRPDHSLAILHEKHEKSDLDGSYTTTQKLC